MTTEAPVKVCSHLMTGEQRSYMIIDGSKFCLDCVAGIYEKTKDNRLTAGWLIGRRGRGNY